MLYRHPSSPIAFWTAFGLATWAATSAAFSAPQFEGPTEISSSVRGASAVVPVDVDGDGDLDVVACSFGDNTVFWLETRAPGLDPVRRIVMADLGRPSAAAAGDFDADGDVDLLVSLDLGDRLVLLDGLGDAEFAGPQLLGSTSWLGRHIEVGDLDGDGDLDAVAANDLALPFGPGAILIENLGGILAPARLFPGSDGAGLDVRFKDIDGDGLLDVVYCTFDRILWSRNAGGLQFEPAQIVAILSTPARDLGFADFDGDGDEDIAATIDQRGEVVFVENLTQGSSVSYGPPIVVPFGGSDTSTLAVADVDLDGDLDVVIAADEFLPLVRIENLGGMTFQAFQGLADEAPGRRSSIFSADLDGDGFTDVVAARRNGEIELFRGAAVGAGGVAFESEVQLLNSRTLQPASLASIDDGVTDLLVMAGASGIQIASEVEPGQYGAPQAIAFADVGARGVAAGDADADGDDDLFFVDSTGELGWIEQDASGLGALRAIDALTVNTPAALLREPIPVDLDSDGDIDLLFASRTGNQWSLYADDQTAPGQFSPRRTVETSFFDYNGMETGDIDGDGLIDLVVEKGQGQLYEIRWLRGIGGGVFAPSAIVLLPGLDDVYMSLGDLDEDGRDEIYWSVESNPRIRRTQWLGSAFSSPFTVATLPGDMRSLQVTGAAGDDFGQVLASYEDPAPGVLRRYLMLRRFDSFGLFVTVQTIGELSVEVDDFVLLDAGRDGDRDVVMAMAAENRVSLWTNVRRTPLGIEYCFFTDANSTGLPARMTALGTALPGAQDLRVVATGLPAGATTLFLGSRTSSVVQGPGGSLGSLCLGGSIGRFARPGEIQTASPNGVARLDVDVRNLPQPSGAYFAGYGEVWRFQAWYRDSVGGTGTSNFSTALAVPFVD